MTNIIQIFFLTELYSILNQNESYHYISLILKNDEPFDQWSQHDNQAQKEEIVKSRATRWLQSRL